MTQHSQFPSGALDTVFSSLKHASAADPYPTAKVRKDRIRRLLDVLLRNDERICDALSADFGHRAREQSYFAEVTTTARSLRIAKSKVRHWMRREHRHSGFPLGFLGARSAVHYLPLGVVGVISPWNFPVNLALAPMAGILAAGNRVALKPSELTPSTADLLREMISSAFAPEEIAVVTGGPEVAAAFSALPFDHLLYTGGEGVARHIMRAAAEHLTPLTLELGGKSPVLIGKSADLNRAARSIAFGKIFNAGQICLAPDYVLVPEERKAELVTAIQGAVQKMLPPEQGGKQFVSIVNQSHFVRLKSLVDDARASGAEVISLDWTASVAREHEQGMLPITLVLDVCHDQKLLQQEIFGPVLPILGYRHFPEAVEFVNAKPRPLALYFFGKQREEIDLLIKGTMSGGLTINDVIMQYSVDDLPFGGVGASGVGAYHGMDGFRRFSHARAVFRQSRLDVAAMFRPPYGKGFMRLMRFMARYG